MKYLIIIPVKEVTGHQIFEIEATSEKDALARVQHATWVSDELEVEGLDYKNATVEAKD
jgi:hypothetical protein